MGWARHLELARKHKVTVRRNGQINSYVFTGNPANLWGLYADIKNAQKVIEHMSGFQMLLNGGLVHSDAIQKMFPTNDPEFEHIENLWKRRAYDKQFIELWCGLVDDE